ncbi:sensor histidine kinase [Gemmatimonas sp.]|jgi:signal transduction histidine kinase|uniref:sensor histidine kinase n=1 Tax=Gemmatimonas sp. TaxID=1962908 RepID=UPI00391F4F95
MTPPAASRHVPLNRALLTVIASAMLVGVVPAGIALDRELARGLVERARDDLQRAPRILADRNTAIADAMMMHAKELAHQEGLIDAVAQRNGAAVARVVEEARGSIGTGQPLVSAAAAGIAIGPTPGDSLLAETRAGRMPVAMAMDGATVRTLALAPIERGGAWLGAAGVTRALDATEAAGLKGLTRSEVIVVSRTGRVTASTMDTTVAHALAQAISGATTETMDRTIDGDAYLLVRAPLAGAGFVVFTRRLNDELSVLPSLRRTAALAALFAALIMLLLGTLLMRRVTRPVHQLAAAATAMRNGAFEAPLPQSRISEVAQVAQQFAGMRTALRRQLEELQQVNETLQDRTQRLSALQSDLMQRERLAVAGRLVGQLAHEIRNPIAALRNTLEVVRRRVTHDQEAHEFTELAINELLRMHELTEQMLDVSRPRRGGPAHAHAVPVARDVARLLTAGVPHEDLTVQVQGAETIRAAIAPDALKQVLLNLLQNAREAVGLMREPRGTVIMVAIDQQGAIVTIDVSDNGPGVPESLAERVFDPFFTTKADLHGVGLGLFVAEGLIRAAGGRLTLQLSTNDGAHFRIALPVADSRPSTPAAPAEPASRYAPAVGA